MLSIVTSFRARALARDWDHHVWLLERALRSMLAQARGDVRVVVACHEVPETSLAGHPMLHFLPVSFPPPARDNDDMCVDKVLKLSAGAEWAIAGGARHVMFSDADDLVSQRVGALVEDHPAAPGWYSASELFHSYGARFLRHHSIADPSSGPCVLVRAELLRFDTPPYSGPWVELVEQGGEGRYLSLLARHGRKTSVLAAAGLSHFRTLMEREGHPLAPMPFPPNVVINHTDSMSHVSGGVGSYERSNLGWRRRLGRARQRLGWLPTLRWLTTARRREFSIPDNADIPLSYRNRGSLLWR